MERIIGIIPAGGQAKRIHGFFKEMMPIGTNNEDKSKFLVSSERIIQNIINGGATSIHFVLSKDKTFIMDYYTNQGLFSDFMNWNQLDPKKDNRGMPFTIDQAYNSTIHADYVLMGMPDTVIEPPESFSILLSLLKNTEADLALGLYHIDKRNKGGYVEFNNETKIITRHIDKTSDSFPDEPDNSWAIACWNKKFTEYIHEKVKKFERIVSNQKDDEFIFGHLIDAAIADQSIKVVADFVDEKNFYWDITEPEKYFDLLRYYSPGRPFTKIPAKKVFIGHGRSPAWESLRDYLQIDLQLEWEEFNRIPVAGKTTQQRLNEMVNSVSFAFLVMTAEEEDREGNLRTRDNVIHETGLFQGKLGVERAIILLEEGCQEFSNITGLSQIRFPKENILARREEIRNVLKREGFTV